jgi:hypothetical protein
MMVREDSDGFGLAVGCAIADITPNGELSFAGGPAGVATRALHPLKARALWLRGEGSEALLIVCDLLLFGQDLVETIRARIAGTYAIAGSSVILAGTHTHCGPAVMDLRLWGKPDPAYVRDLTDVFVNLAGSARKSLRATEVRAGSVECPGIGVNRRRPDGPVNNTVSVMSFADPGGAIRAVLVNHAAHPVNLHSSGLWTPDFPHFVDERVRAALGGDVMVMTITGACGDVNPANFTLGIPDESKAKETGARIASQVVRIARGLRKVTPQALSLTTRRVDLPFAPLPSRAEILAIRDERRKRVEDVAAGGSVPGEYHKRSMHTKDRMTMEWADEALRALETDKQPTSREAELSLIRIGHAGILAISGEPFAEIGMRLQSCSGLQPLLIAALANGYAGYLPPDREFAECGYETVEVARYMGVYTYLPGVGGRVERVAEELVRSAAACPVLPSDAHRAGSHGISAVRADGVGDAIRAGRRV